MNDTGTLGNIIYKHRVGVVYEDGPILQHYGEGICTKCGEKIAMLHTVEDQIFKMAEDHLHIPIDMNELWLKSFYPEKYGDLGEGPF